MKRLQQVLPALSKLLIVSVALGVGSNQARAVGGPHGAGAHAAVPHGGYGHGGYGYGRGYGYGPGYRGGYYGGYYGYPFGLGFGIGFGYGGAYGFAYGYGYPYGYGYNYGYPYGGYPGGGYYGNSFYEYGGGYPFYGNVPPPGAYPTYFPYGAIAPLNSDPVSGGGPLLSGNPAADPDSPAGALPVGAGGPLPAPSARASDSEVALVVHVPEGATVWVNGAKTNQNGSRREFVSTGLKPGRTYTFLVRAQWTGPTGLVQDTDRFLTVQAGERRTVDFGP